MSNTKFLGWAALSLLVLAFGVLLVTIWHPAIEIFDVVNYDAAFLVISVLAIMATAIGLLALRTPQGKVAAICGFLLIAMFVYLIPVAVQTG
jgi:hypothetical protein